MNKIVLIDECAKDFIIPFHEKHWTVLLAPSGAIDKDLVVLSQNLDVVLVTRDKGFNYKWRQNPFKLVLVSGVMKRKQRLTVLAAAQAVLRSDSNMGRVMETQIRFMLPNYQGWQLPLGLT
jgi:hypothetical protein